MTKESFYINKEKITLKCWLITNNPDYNGYMIPINKVFYIDVLNNNLIKKSNAIVFNATFQEFEFQTFFEFDNFLKQLYPNQCICLGKSKHGFTHGLITTKGQENISLNKISRSNDFTSNREIQPILFDLDPDSQMPENIKNINNPQLFKESLIKIFGQNFEEVSLRIGFGSSYGIKNSNTNEQLTVSWSMHAYSIFKNVTEEKINILIEYIKRKCVELGFWYLKIHKDGSTSYRTLIDLSVVQSVKSRLIFEAPATIYEPLVQEIPKSEFFNCSNGINPFDIDNLSYDGLLDWRPIFEKEKEKREVDINRIKEEFKKNKIEELIQKHYLDSDLAKKIVNNYIDTKEISSSIFIKNSIDDNNYQIGQYLIVDIINSVFSFDVYDFLEPEKGIGKSKIYINNIFDAKVTTYLRGGNTYKVSFNVEEINWILDYINYNRDDIDSILDTLINYLVEKNFREQEVNNIKNKIDSKYKDFNFHYNYWNKFINKKVQGIMKEYAFLIYKGKSGYIKTNKDELEFSIRSDLIEKFRNLKFSVPNPNDPEKMLEVKPFEYWSESIYRRDYENIVFTDRDISDKDFNLFKGFPYKPIDHDDIDLSAYFELVKDVINDSNENYTNVTHSFIAQIIQDPFNKLGTSLILYGKKRIGKGSFVKIILELLGSTLSMQTSKKEDVFARFNIHIMYKLLVYLNEAVWSGDKKIESEIKSLITDDDMSYEVKNGPKITGKNSTRLILDGNDIHIVPATYDEGRYIALFVSAHKKGNKEFFKVVNEIRNNKKAMEKLMYFYSTFNYKPYEDQLREAPKTKFLGVQIKRNFNLIQEWWFSCLQEGKINNVSYIGDAKGIRISNDNLWNSFEIFHGKNKLKYFKKNNFYDDIKDEFLDDIIIKNNQKMPGTNIYAKVLAPLKVCREKFIKKYYQEEFENMDSQEWTLNNIFPSTINS